MSEIGIFKKLTVGQGIRVVSLFAGAGGLDLGFDLAGFDVVYATDIDKTCCQTLKANLGINLSSSTLVEQADIRQINLSWIQTGIDLVIGGPPCQSFSASGRRAGGAPGRLDERGTLFEAYCRIIAQLQPRAFLFENVRGILGTNKGADWKAITEAFKSIGYNVSYRILDALDYGVPQQRERLVLVGHKLAGDFLFPRPTHGPDSECQVSHISAHKALADISGDIEDKKSLTLQNGKYAHLLPLVPPGDNYLFFTAKRGHPTPIFAYRSRFSDFLYKANPNAPIKTLIASPGKYTGPFHWDNRSFTVREYMRLQGFPDTYVFTGKRTDQIKQIGNSVSPKLAYQLAQAIAHQIFDRNVDSSFLNRDEVLSFDKRKGQKAAKTKKMHLDVASQEQHSSSLFLLANYRGRVLPVQGSKTFKNVNVQVDGEHSVVDVHADETGSSLARMEIVIFRCEQDVNNTLAAPEARLTINAFGDSIFAVQTMWNAIDDWVIRSSKFHSLFELYGHFTEPHPIFKITKFDAISNAPVVAFAKHISDFTNCSVYYPREHLTSLFGVSFGANNFLHLVKMLRSHRFDIRCHETNVAIPKDVYMVSYPFSLPYGKQMNFSVKTRSIE